jgi:hypothetical protein
VTLASGNYFLLLNTIIFCQTLSLYYLASKQAIRVRYTTIETKEADHIGYNGLLFPHDIYNTGNCFCVNSSVYNLYNNDVIVYTIKIKSHENRFVCE